MRPQPRVQPALGQQGGLIALLDDAAGVDHDQAVHGGDGGQAGKRSANPPSKLLADLRILRLAN